MNKFNLKQLKPTRYLNINDIFDVTVLNGDTVKAELHIINAQFKTVKNTQIISLNCVKQTEEIDLMYEITFANTLIGLTRFKNFLSYYNLEEKIDMEDFKPADLNKAIFTPVFEAVENKSYDETNPKSNKYYLTIFIE